MVINYAHRGASGYCPENTLSSFIKAIELGCDGIETDVQMTSDGELVLIHDEKVNRTTNGKGFVKDYTLKDLKKLDAGSWYDKKFRKETIPTAVELLTLAKEKNIRINFELKNGIVLYPDLEKKIIDLIYKYGMEHNVIFSSFNHYSMFHCKEISSEIKTALLYGEGLYKPNMYCKSVKADAIHPDFHAINDGIIKDCNKDAVMVNAWTVNDEETMKRLISYGIDGIITNYPDKLRSIILQEIGNHNRE